ncbi:connectin-like isoform X2 [Cotesia glomerata]|uniref:connectin-like isoform X2 n=1 Tax=Cotesia glomerata TaxID=32391 RepID=UPI001D02A2A0|nr:connectin-like isoform X2 [Cotesia glomerata]
MILDVGLGQKTGLYPTPLSLLQLQRPLLHYLKRLHPTTRTNTIKKIKMKQLTKLIFMILVCGGYSMPSSHSSVQTISTSDSETIKNLNNINKGEKAAQINICNLEQRQVPIFCTCDADKIGNATEANCVILDVLKPDDIIWNYFMSQPLLEKLSFKVRIGGIMSHVPTKAIRSLTQLKQINFRHANFEEITEGAFANEPSVIVVDIAECGIKQLKSHAFVNMTNIDFINLDDNQIVEINREVFVNLPVLKKLFINRNNITSLHDRAFKHLTSLLELELSNNNIEVITTEHFIGLKSLVSLSLRSNKIAMLGEHTFIEMQELQKLEIDNNLIEYIHPKAFENMRNLRTLNLSSNKLKYLAADIFTGALSINNLDLQNNTLVRVTFDNIKPIITNFYGVSSYLSLDDNQLTCDCNLAWIKGLRNETTNQKLKDSLDLLTCFEEQNGTLQASQTMENDNAHVTSGKSKTGEISDINKSKGKHRIHDANNYMKDNANNDNEHSSYLDSTSKFNREKLVNGKVGYMKNLFDVKVEEPCPEQSRDDPMASEQPSNHRENAAVASSASTTYVPNIATIGQYLYFLSLLIIVVV